MKERFICYNCFKERDSQEGPCPYCGFDLSENVKKYPVALRAGTVLNGRYIVGRVLGQGGFGITYLAWDTQLEAKVAVKEYMPGSWRAELTGLRYRSCRMTGARVLPTARSGLRRKRKPLPNLSGTPTSLR